MVGMCCFEDQLGDLLWSWSKKYLRESESGNLILRRNGTEDFVKELFDHILKNVVDENIGQYVKDMLGHIISNVVAD